MTASALREIAVGVKDLDARARFYAETFGLAVTSRGEIDAPTAAALWGIERSFGSVTLGRPDVPHGARIRLTAVGDGPTPRPSGELTALGPVGVGFTTQGIQDVYDRVAVQGVRFHSPPLRLTPGNVGPTGPARYETFGQADDGEFVVLIERINAPAAYGMLSETLRVSEPLHSSHVVGDLEACSRFMVEALDHQTVIRDSAQEAVFAELMGIPADARFRFEMLHRPGAPSGRIIFIEYDGRGGRSPDVQPPARGVHALRYECDDVDALLARIGPAGGQVLRGPVAIDSQALGRGRAVVVRPPFGTLLEIWQPQH